MNDANQKTYELSALEFINQFGWEAATSLAESVGTNRPYFSQIAYGHRRPSYELAKSLVAASGNKLSLTKLMEKSIKNPVRT